MSFLSINPSNPLCEPFGLQTGVRWVYKNMKNIGTTKIALFKGKQIRKIIFNNEWWFSVVDVIEALTDSLNPRDYWYKMKIRVKDEDGLQLSTICLQLKLLASDGKLRKTDCANTEGLFRIIQSIPSPINT